jgi:hypothetical protein
MTMTLWKNETPPTTSLDDARSMEEQRPKVVDGRLPSHLLNELTGYNEKLNFPTIANTFIGVYQQSPTLFRLCQGHFISVRDTTTFIYPSLARIEIVFYHELSVIKKIRNKKNNKNGIRCGKMASSHLLDGIRQNGRKEVLYSTRGLSRRRRRRG